MRQISHVLCAIDFSDESRTLLHVLEPGIDADPLPSRSLTVPEYSTTNQVVRAATCPVLTLRV